jgi:hypothetical protein
LLPETDGVVIAAWLLLVTQTDRMSVPAPPVAPAPIAPSAWVKLFDTTVAPEVGVAVAVADYVPVPIELTAATWKS